MGLLDDLFSNAQKTLGERYAELPRFRSGGLVNVSATMTGRTPDLPGERRVVCGFDTGSKDRTVFTQATFVNDKIVSFEPVEKVDYAALEARVAAYQEELFRKSLFSGYATSTAKEPSVLDVPKFLRQVKETTYWHRAQEQETVIWRESPIITTTGLAKWGLKGRRLRNFRRFLGERAVLTPNLILLAAPIYDARWFLAKLVYHGILRQEHKRAIERNIETGRYLKWGLWQPYRRLGRKLWSDYTYAAQQAFWLGILWCLWEVQHEPMRTLSDIWAD